MGLSTRSGSWLGVPDYSVAKRKCNYFNAVDGQICMELGEPSKRARTMAISNADGDVVVDSLNCLGTLTAGTFGFSNISATSATFGSLTTSALSLLGPLNIAPNPLTAGALVVSSLVDTGTASVASLTSAGSIGAVSLTSSGPVTGGSVVSTGSATVGSVTAGALTVSGTSSMASLTSSGAITAGSLVSTGSATLGGVTAGALIVSGTSSMADVTMSGNLNFSGATGTALNVTDLSVEGVGFGTETAITTSTFTSGALISNGEYGFNFSVTAPKIISAVGLLPGLFGPFTSSMTVTIWDIDSDEEVAQVTVNKTNLIAGYYQAEAPLITLESGFSSGYCISVHLTTSDFKSTAAQSALMGWTLLGPVFGTAGFRPDIPTGDVPTCTIGINLYAQTPVNPAFLVDSNSRQIVASEFMYAQGGFHVTGGEAVDNLTVSGSLTAPGFINNDWITQFANAGQTCANSANVQGVYDGHVLSGSGVTIMYTTGGTFSITTTGLYMLSVQTEWQANAVGIRETWWFDNLSKTYGRVTQSAASAGDATWQMSTAVIPFTAGQHVTVVLKQTTGGDWFANPSTASFVTVQRIG